MTELINNLKFNTKLLIKKKNIYARLKLGILLKKMKMLDI